MLGRPPELTLARRREASDVYKRQVGARPWVTLPPHVGRASSPGARSTSDARSKMARPRCARTGTPSSGRQPPRQLAHHLRDDAPTTAADDGERTSDQLRPLSQRPSVIWLTVSPGHERVRTQCLRAGRHPTAATHMVDHPTKRRADHSIDPRDSPMLRGRAHPAVRVRRRCIPAPGGQNLSLIHI